MKNLIYSLLFIFFVTGCAREADLVFDNRTSQNLYYTIDDEIQEPLSGHTSRKHSFKLGKQYLFNTPEKTVKVTAEGETFVTPGVKPGESSDRYITLDSSYYKKDYNLIFYPNRAGFKIINESTEVITSFVYKKVRNNGEDTTLKVFNEGLQNGEEYWCVFDYNDPPFTEQDKDFTYRFEITLQGYLDTVFVLADRLRLERGQQFIYVHNLPNLLGTD